MPEQSNQEKAWVLGAFTTIATITISCIVGSVVSTVSGPPIFAFGLLISASIVNTLTNKLAAIKADANAKIAAVKVEQATAMIQESAVQTEMKLAKIAQVTQDTNATGEKIHILVNSNMAKALKAVAIALRTVATLRDTPENEKAAQDAEDIYADHEAKQRLVDGKEAAAAAAA